MRLIDGDKMRDYFLSLHPDGSLIYGVVAAQMVDEQPTIDPETLPIMQELRANIAIQEKIIENHHNPFDTDKIVKVTLENANLKQQLSKVTVERDTLLRERKCLEDTEPVKHAKWEWYPDRKDRQELLCTNCEFEAPYDYQGEYMFTKYCPYCGAKMDLEEKQNVHGNPNK